MSANLNHMVCPTCGHDFFTAGAWATCDACHTMFYAAQSRTSRVPFAGWGWFSSDPQPTPGTWAEIPAVLCEHANECPAVCPCPPHCYCRRVGSAPACRRREARA